YFAKEKYKLFEHLDYVQYFGEKNTLDGFTNALSTGAFDSSALSFSTLKMDKSMIDPILTNPRMLDIAQSIIAMCHKQSIEVVAEGVEQHEQLTALEQINCDIMQGYLINKPMPIDDFEALYQRKRD
ncbi:MAG: EAL domain-containing protein, partial [Anaerovoracaceae bacterium]